MKIHHLPFLLLGLGFLSGCFHGGNNLMVGSIIGPSEVPEGTTVEFHIDAHSDSGISYLWAVEPVGFGSIENPDAATTLFTAPEVDTATWIVLRVVVNSDNDGPVVRSEDILIVDSGDPDDGEDNDPPVAGAHASTTFVEPGIQIQFYDDSTDPDGEDDIVKWEWDFSYDPDVGFQIESEEQEPLHVYEEEGIYFVQLRVEDAGGLSDMLDMPLEIEIEAPFLSSMQEVGLATLKFDSIDVAMTDNYTYMLSSNNEFKVIDTNDPGNPRMAASLNTGLDLTKIAVDGDFAYVISDEDCRLQIINIENPESPEIVNTITIEGNGEDIAVQDGYAYIALELEGVRIVDVDPPSDAHIVHWVESEEACSAIDVEGNLAVVVNKTGSNMLILDISVPENALIANTISANWYFDVEIMNGYAFTCNQIKIGVYDIDPPESAQQVNEISYPFLFCTDLCISNGYLYLKYFSDLRVYKFDFETHDLTISASCSFPAQYDAAMAACGNRLCIAYGGTIWFKQFNEPDSIIDLAGLTSMGDVKDVAVKDNHLYVVAGYIYIFDISDPYSPSHIRTLDFPYGGASRILIQEDNAFTLNERFLGADLIVYDLSNIDNPVPLYSSISISFFWFGDLSIENGFLYCVSNNNFNNYSYPGALDIFEIEPLETAHHVTGFLLSDLAFDIEVQNNFAYISSGDPDNFGIQVFDVSSPSNPFLRSETLTANLPRGLVIRDDLLYVASHADDESTLEFYTITPSGDLEFLNKVITEGYAIRLIVQDSYAYIANLQGVQIFDVHDPMNLTSVASFTTPGQSINLEIEGPYLYLAEVDYGVRIFQLW